MINESKKLRSKSSKQHSKYQKFVNDIYSCIRQRDKDIHVKRCSTPQVVSDNFPLLSHQEKVPLTTIQQAYGDGKVTRASSQMKNIKFKNFLNALDDQQRRVSVDNMNLLGLQVRKISYCQKVKKASQKHLGQLFDENLSSPIKNDKIRSASKLFNKKIINCEQVQEFTSQKMGITGLNFKEGTQIMKVQKIAPRTSFIRSRQNIGSRSEQKRKTVTQFQNPIYDNRINSYREQIFRLNIAHGVYIETEKDLKEDFTFKAQMRYKAWVGSGNNGSLIKGLIKRRFWWQLLQDKSLNVNFVWTQLKVPQFISSQSPAPLWVKDSSKFWGKEVNSQSPPKTAKRLTRTKKIEKDPEEEHLYKIFTQDQILKYKQYSRRISNKTYEDRKNILQLTEINTQDCKMHNHLANNFYLGNKKALFYCLKNYYDLIGQNAFTRIPLTFHIKKGFKDLQYKRFLAYYKKRQALIKKQQKDEGGQKGEKKKMRNVWIVKPGELTNRGHGITVIDEVYELNQIMKQQAQHENGSEKTFIVQLYLDRPLLYQKRKFDIRHYMLITHVHGLMRAYWYKQGYIRTSSYQFDIHNFERQIHLTNDAVQKYCSMYGKYEPGNKLSYAEFQRYLDSTYPKKGYNFQQQILPQMKNICLDAVKSSYLKLSPQRLKHNFEIFGLDFMIDENFQPWLIEINTNPCLELSSPLLARIIPQAVDQALRLSLDIVFPPPCHYPNTSKHLAPEAGLQSLNYELIFDEKRDGMQLRTLYKKQGSNNMLEQIGNISQDEVYQDDGKDIAIDQLL